MRIPNKFSGYRFDGTRNLHDPVTLAAVASQAGGIGAAGAALGTTSAALLPAAAAAAPIATAATVAPTLASTLPGILPEATGILPQTLGGALPEAAGIMQGAQAVVPEVAKAAGTELAQTAGQNLAAPTAPPAGGTPFTPPAQPLPPAGDPVQMQLNELANRPPNEFLNNRFEQVVSKDAAPIVKKEVYNTNPIFNQKSAFGKPSPEISISDKEIAARVGERYGAENPMKNGFDMAMEYANKNPLQVAGGLYSAQKMGIFGDDNVGGPPKDNYKSKFDSSKFRAGNDAPPVNQYASAPNFYSKTYAEGGNVGAVEAMSNMNAVGNNSMYPMANIPRLDYANPMQQRPVSQNMMTMGGDVPTDPYTGMQKFAGGGISGFRKQLAKDEADRKAQGEALMEQVGSKVKGPGIFDYTLEQRTGRPDETAMNMLEGAAKRAGVKIAKMPKANIPQDFTYAAANGGIMHGLGGYSDGGRLLKGPGDGVSDSIPAVIGNKQPARLADGEFVVPARIVSELGNGSTEAGARQLYAMMERIQKGRRKSVGKNKVAVDSKSKKHLPA